MAWHLPRQVKDGGSAARRSLGDRRVMMDAGSTIVLSGVVATSRAGLTRSLRRVGGRWRRRFCVRSEHTMYLMLGGGGPWI